MRPCATKRSGGFSYIEVLVATVLIAVALVPAIESLHTAALAARAQERFIAEHYHLQTRMAQLDDESFSALDAAAQSAGDASVATSYSDASGSAMRRIVRLARYDLDANAPVAWSAGDYGLLWLRVEIEGSSSGFETLVVP